MMMGMIMSGVQLMEMLPFSVMVVMEGCTIILTIWAKTAMTDYDMSPFVFVVYTHVLSSIILLLSTFVFNCRSRSATHPSLFSFGLFVRCFLLGLTGIAVSQNLAFLGLSYSSPILVCAMGLMLPTFSFLLSVILKRTNADWRSPTFQAKVLGTVISIMGAVIVELYKGPYIRPSSVLSSSSYMVLFQKAGQYLKFSSSATEHWVLGGLLLVGASISVSVWNIIQMGTMKLYPEVEVMEVVSYYSLLGTIQCVIFSLFIEKSLSAWKIKLNMDLLLIVLTACFAGLVRSHVHNWCMKLKGIHYVPKFKPFGIVFATIFGVSLSANNLHYGSVLGAVLTGVGYFTIMWGQIREDDENKDQRHLDSTNSEAKVPLLEEDVGV
ncbi:WAT1-related protein At1g70260 isoform X1 [Argentina anserina]|uniref:WAT1-related protein At1g70260 isoform X1 n=1 Tax=Argentina anserina TaxID=57926 RepID=UPI0021765F70|nr:WAT1-related protein At1g70260 isoform X1 [Potentilla anserina]